MCGFVGLVGSNPAQRDKIQPAVGSVKHRGPDDDGMYRDPQIVLGHSRLSVIDLSPRGHQPMVDKESGLVIVYNGEIYNYQALRQSMPSESFASDSDTEVILKLYARYGAASVVKLRGMFAFAIWDPKKQSLFLARDRFGIKPLFYHHAAESFSFASEIKALLTFGLQAKPNLMACRDYIASGKNAVDQTTFFDGVRSLEPAHWALYEKGKLTKSRYWALDLTRESPITNPTALEDALWEKWREVAKLHLVSDIPVGISLSAGVDSNFLLHLLQKVGASNLHAFTFGYDDPTYDHIRMFEALGSSVPLRHHKHRMKEGSLLVTLMDAIRHFEFPTVGVGTLSSFQMMRLAKEQNVKVLLTGEGSDEVFAGYKYYYYYLYKQLIERGHKEQLSAEVTAYNRVHQTHYAPDSPEFLGLLPDLTRGVATVQAPDATSLGDFDFSGKVLKGLGDASSPYPASSLKERMKLDLESLKVPKLLMFQDRASMAWGVETRVPFLDHELVEFAYSLPGKFLLRDGITKAPIRALMEKRCGFRYQPESKLYVATPQREWLKTSLYPDILTFVEDGILRESGLVDFDRWKSAYESYARSPELGNSFFVWKMLDLEALFRTFFPTYSRTAA